MFHLDLEVFPVQHNPLDLSNLPHRTSYPHPQPPTSFLLLPSISYSLPPTPYLLLPTSFILPPSSYLLPSTPYLLPSISYSLPPSSYPLPPTLYPLPSTPYPQLLPSTLYLLPSTFCTPYLLPPRSAERRVRNGVRFPWSPAHL